MFLRGDVPVERAASWERVVVSTSAEIQASKQTPKTCTDESDVCGPLMGESTDNLDIKPGSARRHKSWYLGLVQVICFKDRQIPFLEVPACHRRCSLSPEELLQLNRSCSFKGNGLWSC